MSTSAQELLVDVSAALAVDDDRSRDRALAAAALAVEEGRVEAVALEEALLQSYLFLGYPAALNGLGAWRELSGSPAGDPVADDWEAWVVRGREVCRAVYADQYEGLRDNVRAIHPDLERWMVAEGYGKVLGRPGLALELRELCVVAILAVRGAPVQLYSHLRGALQVGVEPPDVEAALGRALRWLPTAERGAKAAMARSVWSRVRERTTGGDSAGT